MNTHLNVLYKKADHIARYVVRFFRNYYTVRAIRKRARLRAILLELGSRRQTLINMIPATHVRMTVDQFSSLERA